MKKWWALFVRPPRDHRAIALAIGLGLITICLRPAFRGSAPPTAGPPLAVDTHIPRGFVLIPIEAENYEALDSILGRFGVVDLFQIGGGSSERKLVARNVRLLRAPQNPSQFAVLVPEKESARILRSGGIFTVVLKRPGRPGTEIVNDRSRIPAQARRRITYEGE